MSGGARAKLVASRSDRAGGLTDLVFLKEIVRAGRRISEGTGMVKRTA